MREIRTSGSEGGGTDIGPPYPYPSHSVRLEFIERYCDSNSLGNDFLVVDR